MRIISGTCKGRKLSQIQGKEIRPTSDRTREAIFNILGERVVKARVLDLFAGTGALGLEALSRGAEYAVFVDVSKQSCQVIRENIKRCRYEKVSELYCHDLAQGLSPLVTDNRVDLVFLDPPYGQKWIETVISFPDFMDVMDENTLVVAEYSIKENPFRDFKHLDIFKQKKYSKTMVSFLQKTSSYLR